MMNAHANLQVWLDTLSNTRPSIVVPYVRSAQDSNIRYRVEVRKHGPGGSSTIGQGGDIHTQAGQATALSEFSLNVAAGDECSITLSLSANGQSASTYHFACPR
ncbi:MAG TPA: curli-like amyloid fiber formation chaperone CsgH [Castellaniella sp.]|uniref:curli-like amyloid fiber formation chaperone CsgH n=1 Tax=Castellaniella sp. TaxID=1955812 RepID=UPI002EF5DAAA